MPVRISEFIEALESAKNEVGDCQVFFSYQGRDDLVMEETDLGERHYAEEDDCIVVDLVPDVV